MNRDSTRESHSRAISAASNHRGIVFGLGVLFSLVLMGCGEDPFEPPPDLVIPETLKVPPVEHKQVALQSLLDGVINSLAIGDEFCTVGETETRSKTVTCQHPNNGGTVEFVGDLFEQNRELIVFGERVRSIRHELTLKSIKLENYKYMASVGRQRIPPPNGCKAEVVINGEGSIYTIKEDLLTDTMGRIPLNSGGVYQGAFTVSQNEREYRFEFTNHGFYYRRDITPIIITPTLEESQEMRRAPIEALQVSLVYSGGFDLNEQLYSYQDVYIEVLTSQHWNEGCEQRSGSQESPAGQTPGRPQNQGPSGRGGAPPGRP